MGKSWKARSHLNTGYPYNPIRAAHMQGLGPRWHQDDEETLLGMYGKAGHPVFSKAAIDQTNDDMKHLEFVRAYGQYYCTKVAYAYSSSCAVLPASCRTGLRNLENKVTTLSAPIINGLQQSSERVLWSLDSKVDSIVKVAQRTMQPKELVEAERDLLVGSNSEARSAYLQQFVDSLHYLKEHGITSTAKQAVNSILRRVDEGQCLPAGKGGERLPITQDAQDTWSKLASLPPVSMLIETAQPSIDYTQRKYGNAHDAVVASATYNRTLEAAAEILQRLQETPVYQAAAVRLYPLVSGVADPAIARISNSPYTKAVVEHLKPVPKQERHQQTEADTACILV